MYTEEQFLKKVNDVHGDSVEVIGRFKGVTEPILFRTKYGTCKYPKARQLYDEKVTPSIKCALNAGFKLSNELNELDDVKILVYKKYK